MAAERSRPKYSKAGPGVAPKLRAQNQVLKKGVVDEQANSASLKDQLKQRDQSLRKVEQEMDSLSFRNQQLAKREELAASEARSKKGKSKGDSPSRQGLQTQNFYEAGEQHRRQEGQMRARLEELEAQSAQHQTVVDSLNGKYTDTVERLQSDKARLEMKGQTWERESKECRMRAEECQQQLRRCQSELSRQLKQSSSVIQEKVPFNDTKFSDYNSLNVPPHNRRHQLKARDVASQALGFAQDLVAALLNFHSYTEQRVHIYPRDSSIEPISPLNQKEGLLQLQQSITEDTVTVLETVGKLKVFADHFSAYSQFLQKILPYQLKSLDEECSAPLCTSALTAKNRELQCDVKCVTAQFDKLSSYINLLALPKMSKHYSQKAGLEGELPTVTEKLRTTTECLLGSLVSLTNSTGKPRPPSVQYQEALCNRRVLTSSTESREGLTQQVHQSQEKIARLEQEKEHWLLEAQLGKVRLEKESQRIGELEAQLAAATGGGALASAAAAAAALTTVAGAAAAGSPTDGPAHDREDEEVVQQKGAGKEAMLSTSLVGMLSTTSSTENVGDEESREQLIKDHYMTRVGELTTQLQVSDSKAVHFHAECRALAKRLALAERVTGGPERGG
ncbi:hypothetical protein CRUP_009609 [Coryphaenoides rupestris]|nr:hypothetical protein CRUP_009609 [Coryphaenoides rupestris]